MAPEIQKIGQIAITATDVTRATTFYRDVLNIPFLFSAGPNLAFFSLGGVRLMITKSENEDFAGTSTLYFKVNDINAAMNGLRGRADLLDEPHLIADMGDHELWMAFFRDSEGNSMAFMEERAK
jgi:methylmalonyl-CoA/ethylmalonyl-CoA epimerase